MISTTTVGSGIIIIITAIKKKR
ncbi:hypothetical protein ECTW09195_5029, partial [Escherichia coli TW09195]